MKDKKLLVPAAALLAGAFFPASTAFAQELGPEDAVSTDAVRAATEVEDTEITKGIVWDFRLTSEFHATDNASFRELDETSGNQEIRETDDRHNFGYTSISATNTYQVLPDTTFRFSGSHSGLWGSYQLGGTDVYGNIFFLYDLSVDWKAIDSDGFELGVRVGRQPFEIGGTRRDYFFRDTVDGLVLNAGFGEFGGTLKILGFDVYASQGRPDSVNFLNWHSGRNLSMNMRGDTNTIRTGAVYENTSLLDGLELRLFGFYADIGAGGTGSDRTHDGQLGNFADSDFSWMAGTRVGYQADLGTAQIGAYGEFAHSGGMDRKDVNVGLHDVAIDGNAYGAGLIGLLDMGALALDATLQYFRADGAQYGADGMQFSHGFVSFKGAYAGGLNMARYAGWRPSSYVGINGIHHAEHDQRRQSGTQFIHAGVGANINEMLKLDLGLWHFTDTSSTNLNFAQLNEIADRAPLGYSIDDLRAQQRLGRTLGTEINASLSYRANELLSFYGIGGMFVPGDFYEIEITRNAGTARGSDTPQNFWSIVGGATLAF